MKSFRFLAVLAMLLLAGVSAFAQGTTSGALTGTVTSDGTPLPGATVTLTSPALIGTRTVVSDANGNYNVPALPPGDYTMRVELQGLQPITRTVRITLSGTARVDVDLKVSAVTEAITVTATAPATLETQEIQTNFDSQLIQDLPVARTLLGAVNLAPGVNQNGPGGATTISGGFAFDSTYSVDGAVVNEVLRGQPQNLFIEDAIQETTVQTGAISSEFGRFTGGVVTAISKTGGNEFSGSLRDNVLNPRWTALGEIEEEAARAESEITNIYEATLGGYVMRDRLWFFAAGRYYDYGATRLLGTTTSGETSVPYNGADTETRGEIKLTGQLTQKHSLMASYFEIERDQTNNAFGVPLEASALDASRSLPNTFLTLNYNGILTSNLLIEGLYAKQDFSFVGSGADAAASPERGTNISTDGFGNAGYPTFCGSCSFPEERNNSNGKLKASYFLSSSSLGTHNVSAGYEFYEDILKSDNHQSASDFTLFTYEGSLFDSHTADGPYLSRGANGQLLHSVPNGGAFIIWWPILESSQGNSFRTKSLFINDKWDLNQNLSFNVGMRYDQNKGENSQGVAVADDNNISPRLGVTYDIFGNGRLRANASYSIYASKIANGNVGDSSSGAGSPSLLYWIYYGPDINNATSDQLLDGIFGWFRSIGFTNDRDFLLGGGTSGIQTQIEGSLESPQVREYSIGLGGQVGANGFLRMDYQDREWSNFYTTSTNLETGQIFDPLAGSDLDLTLVTNSDDFIREYKAVLVQGSYRLFNKVTLGGNYTWSTLKGNITGETSGSGPVTAGGPDSYPEFTGFAQNNPSGYLGADQRHKLRAWVSYDLPTPVGTFNFSLLQRFDSGTAYSAIGAVNPARRTACPTCPDLSTLPYSSAPTTVNYYFTDRGALRTDDVTATDLALNYTVPIKSVSLYFQGELLNSLNEQAILTPNTTVGVLRAFNPFTETPQECAQGTATAACLSQFPTGGVWRKGANFGKGLTSTTGSSLLPGGTGGSYQLPRTFRFSFGVRF